MVRPKLKSPQNGTASISELEMETKPIQLPPLNVSGVVVKKKDLVEALRIYVPLISDIQAFEDGDNFYILLEGSSARVTG
jgi:hypothetical protein